MRIEFGEVKIEFPYEKYLLKYAKPENMFDPMFLKSNMEFFSDLQKKIMPTMTNYFEEFTKQMEKQTNKSKADKKDS